MDWAYNIGGEKITMMKFGVDEAMATAFVPVRLGATGDGGLILAGVDDAADMVGVTQDTATAGAGDDITVIVNANAVYRCKLSGGATADTALTVGTAGSGSTTDDMDNITGLTMTNYLDCAVWFLTGANAFEQNSESGRNWRNITTVTDGDTIAFKEDWPQAIAEGDTFLAAARSPGILKGVSLTTNLAQADATDENTAAAEFVVVDLEGRTAANDGATNSFLHILSVDHVFGSPA